MVITAGYCKKRPGVQITVLQHIGQPVTNKDLLQNVNSCRVEKPHSIPLHSTQWALYTEGTSSVETGDTGKMKPQRPRSISAESLVTVLKECLERSMAQHKAILGTSPPPRPAKQCIASQPECQIQSGSSLYASQKRVDHIHWH